MTIGIAIDDFDITINEADMARRARTYHRAMAVPGEAARLRTEAEAKPLKLPVNRRVDERHRSITPDGLSVWYTIQVSPPSSSYRWFPAAPGLAFPEVRSRCAAGSLSRWPGSGASSRSTPKGARPWSSRAW